jgi:hypothetical protein
MGTLFSLFRNPYKDKGGAIMDWCIRMLRGKEVFETFISSGKIGTVLKQVFENPDCRSSTAVAVLSEEEELDPINVTAVFYEENGKIHVSYTCAPQDQIQDVSSAAIEHLKVGTKIWAMVNEISAIVFFGAKATEEQLSINMLMQKTGE